jgi:hypothetical protein
MANKGKARANLDRDLRGNPGIGQSKGAYAMGGDLDYAEGDSTVEGDVENEVGLHGQATEGRVGRTNK